MAQTEIDALCNAKMGEEAEAELRIQPPPDVGVCQSGVASEADELSLPDFQNVRSPSTKIKCRHVKGTKLNVWGRCEPETCLPASAQCRG